MKVFAGIDMGMSGFDSSIDAHSIDFRACALGRTYTYHEAEVTAVQHFLCLGENV